MRFAAHMHMCARRMTQLPLSVALRGLRGRVLPSTRPYPSSGWVRASPLGSEDLLPRQGRPFPGRCAAPPTHMCTSYSPGAVAMHTGFFTFELTRSRSPCPAPRIFDDCVSDSSTTGILLLGSCSGSHVVARCRVPRVIRAGDAVRVPCVVCCNVRMQFLASLTVPAYDAGWL